MFSALRALLRRKFQRKYRAIRASTTDFEKERICVSAFELYCDPLSKILSLSKFLKILHENGMRNEDPFVKNFIATVRKSGNYDDIRNNENILLDRQTFTKSLAQNNVELIGKILKNQLIIPEWQQFTTEIGHIHRGCQRFTEGKVASYIPQLASANPERWALSICSVDGQRESWGEKDDKFCLQSVSKPFAYAIAIEEHGEDSVHRFVGHEPSGRNFNEICLDNSNRPHNPMINSGAIVTTALIRPEDSPWDKFIHVQSFMRRFAGGRDLSFDNATYLSERETGYRNYALGYYMKEYKCFPENTNLNDTIKLYFQMCSLETDTESLAIMASTLANGGINPLNDERVVCNQAVRNTLSLMYSCGMYDYSGQMAFKVGLPAKSGVSGNMIIVIPNIAGIALFSPRLDRFGNSVRGVKFTEQLIKQFNFHQYDSLLHSEEHKKDPTCINRIRTSLKSLKK